MNNKSFTNDNLFKGRKTIFIYFSTNCDECKKINNYLEYFDTEKFNIVLVSDSRDRENIKMFFDKDKVKNFRGALLFDIDNNFPSDFGLGVSYNFPIVRAYDHYGFIMKNINSLEDISEM